MDQPLQLVLNKAQFSLIEKSVLCMITNLQQAHQNTLQNMDPLSIDCNELLAYYKQEEKKYIHLHYCITGNSP
jgi:hypothetical protein